MRRFISKALLCLTVISFGSALQTNIQAMERRPLVTIQRTFYVSYITTELFQNAPDFNRARQYLEDAQTAGFNKKIILELILVHGLKSHDSIRDIQAVSDFIRQVSELDPTALLIQTVTRTFIGCLLENDSFDHAGPLLDKAARLGIEKETLFDAVMTTARPEDRELIATKIQGLR